MSVYDAVFGAQVLEEGRAVRRTNVRHYHLDDDAVFLSILRFGGERFRPVVFQFSEQGRPVDQDDLIVVSQYTQMDHMLQETERFASKFRHIFESGRQLIVPNSATIKALGFMGRALAFRKRTNKYGLTEGQQDNLQVAGRYLIELSRYARTPGQSLVVPLAERMSEHWFTLTAPFERSDLATLYAQVYPQPGDNAFTAALEARNQPMSVGPNMHPIFEESQVYKIYDEVRDRAHSIELGDEDHPLISRLRRIYWTQTEHAHTIMRACVKGEIEGQDEAESVAGRWAQDQKSAKYMSSAHGDPEEPYFARHSPARAAGELLRLETDATTYKARQMLDDAMKCLEPAFNGSIISGTVVDISEREVNKGYESVALTIKMPRELTIDPEDSTFVWEWTHGQIEWEVEWAQDDLIELVGISKFRRDLIYPESGQSVNFIPSPGKPFVRRGPGATPWTHRMDKPKSDEDVMHDRPVDDVPRQKDKATESQPLDAHQEGLYDD